MWTNIFSLLWTILVHMLHFSPIYSLPPLSGGMYDLSAMVQTIQRHNSSIESSIAVYEIRLPDGAEFYFDPTDTDLVSKTSIEIHVQLVGWNEDKLFNGTRLMLCTSADITIDQCSIESSRGPIDVEQKDQRFPGGITTVRTWVFDLTGEYLATKVFTGYDSQHQQSVATLHPILPTNIRNISPCKQTAVHCHCLTYIFTINTL